MLYFYLAEVVPFTPLHSQKAYALFHTTELVRIEAGWSNLGFADFLISNPSSCNFLSVYTLDAFVGRVFHML